VGDAKSVVQTHWTWQSAASPIHTTKVTVPEKPAPPLRLNAKSSKRAAQPAHVPLSAGLGHRWVPKSAAARQIRLRDTDHASTRKKSAAALTTEDSTQATESNVWASVYKRELPQSAWRQHPEKTPMGAGHRSPRRS